MKALAAAVLIVLQSLAAAALFILSVHGPHGLAIGAPVYLAVAAGVTWWASRRAWLPFLAAGTAVLVAAPAVYWILDQAERIANERRVAATQVSDVRDEPILLGGRVVGIKLSYQVVAPARGYFAIYPDIHGAEGFGLQPRRWTFDGRGGLEFGPFEPGRKHAVSVELYPETYFAGPGDASCVRALSRPLLASRAPAPLPVEIYESPYGSPARGGREERTRGSYDMATLYQNLGAAGLPACKVPGQ